MTIQSYVQYDVMLKIIVWELLYAFLLALILHLQNMLKLILADAVIHISRMLLVIILKTTQTCAKE